MYARWAKPGEINDFLNSIKERNKKEYERAISYLNHHKKEIINNYHLLSKSYDSIERMLQKKRIKLENALHSGRCYCGEDVFYVEQYDRYFCEKFDLKDQYHMNFVDREDQAYDFIERDCTFNAGKWVLDLKHKSALPKSVKLSSLYRFAIENGLDCLSEKYNQGSVIEKLNDYMDARKEGVGFEIEVKKILENSNALVYYQQGIKYQYNERRPRYAIPDFIVMSDEEILIIECKLHEELFDDVQKQRYIDLVKFIRDEKNIHKKVSFQYVYKKDGEIKFSKKETTQ